MKNQTKENTPAKTAKHGNKRVTLSGACSAAVENVQNKWALAAKHKAEADQVAGKADSTLATLTAQIGYGRSAWGDCQTIPKHQVSRQGQLRPRE